MHGVILFTSQETKEKLLDILIKIKRQIPVPTWVYGERDMAMQKIHLELGALGIAETCLSFDILIHSIENILNYVYEGKDSSDEQKVPPRQESIRINDVNCSLQFADRQEISLTQLEYKFVSLLATKKNTAVTYEEIYQFAWEKGEQSTTDYREQKYRVSNLAFHIRKKLKKHEVPNNLLRTVRSIGYLLDFNVINDS